MVATLWVLFLAFPIVAGSSQDRSPTSKATWIRVQIPDPVANRATADALDGANALFSRPSCRLLLTDFTDRTGRSLADRLSAFDVDVQTYLTMVLFVDGTRDATCAAGAVAFTEPGSRVVRVCVDELKRTWQKDHAYVIASVIHEVLHTLGLGEN